MGNKIFLLLLVIIQSIYSNDSDWVNVSSPIGRITSVISTDDSTILLGTSKGIQRVSFPIIDFIDTEKMLENEYINSFLMADDVLFACTEKGVYGSTDNGTIWLKKALPDSNFGSLIYTKNKILFSKAFPGNIYSSSDMGETWNEIKFNLPEIKQKNLDWIPHIDTDNNGSIFIAYDSVSYLRSDDNGNNWNHIFVPTHGRNGYERITINDNQLIFSSWGEFVSSTDHGKTWQKIKTPNANLSYLSKSLKGLQLKNYEPDGIFESIDNGLSWVEVPGILEISSIIHLDNYILAIADIYQGSALVISSDNGDNWKELINSFEGINTLSSGPDGLLYSCSEWTGAYRSSDFGLTWEAILNATVIESIAFLGKDILALCSNLDGLFILSDNGKKIIKPWEHGLTDSSITSVIATPGGILYAGGYSKFIDIPLIGGGKTLGYKGGGLWCSQDSGNTWKRVLLDSAYKTTDNGITWLEYNDYSEKYEPANQPDLTINYLGFDLDGNILALADIGYTHGLYMSKNEGESWEKIKSLERHEETKTKFVKSSKNEIFSGISRSTDGGKSFNDVINGSSGEVKEVIELSDGNMLSATSAGIYFLPYKGNTWYPAAFNGYDVNEIIIHGTFVFASANLSSEYRSAEIYRIPIQRLLETLPDYTPEEELWIELNKPFNRKLALFHIDSLGNFWIIDDSAHLAFSADEGKTWKISSLPDDYINDFKISGDNKLVLAATFSGLFCSRYDKIEWKEIELPLSMGQYEYKNARVTSIYIEKDSGIIVSTSEDGPFKNPCADTSKKVLSYFQPFGSEYGRLYTLKNTSQKWLPIETVLPAYSNFVFRGKSGNLFAALHGDGIYVSSDNGIEWSNCNKGLFAENVFYICNIGADADRTVRGIRINSDGIIYAVRGKDIFRTNDEGKSWDIIKPLGGWIYDIYLTKNNQLFAATGTGVFKLSADFNTWSFFSAGLASSAILSLSSKDGYLFAASTDGRVYKTKKKIE